MLVRIGDSVIDLDAIRALPDGERLQAELALAEVLEQRLENPLLFYRPNEGWDSEYGAYHRARERLKAIQGGNRSGKTTAAIVDDIVQAAPPELLSPELLAIKQYECPFYCRIMTPDMERTMKPVIHAHLKAWLPKAMIPKGWDKHYDKQANSLHLECGCRFDFLSYEMAVDKFGGAPLHRCHYDEEPPELIRNECLVRLADWDGDENFSFTPLKGLTWSYRRIWKNRDDPDISVHRVSTTQNENLSKKGVGRIFGGGASGLDSRQAAMRGAGHYMPDIGFVYPDLRQWLTTRPEVGTISRSDILMAIDPGVTVAGLTWTAWDPEGYFVTFDARELRGQDVGGYVKEIKAVNRRWEIDPARIHYVIDPAARARSLTNAESVDSELSRLGIYCEYGQNDIDTGVLMLNRLGREGKWKISESLETFIERLEEYPLKEHPDGSIKPDKTGREHLADSVRYGIAARAWPTPESERDTIYPGDVAFPRPKPQKRMVGVAGDMV